MNLGMMRALLTVWLGSRHKRTLICPSGFTRSRTVMLEHHSVGPSTFWSLPSRTISSSLALTNSRFATGKRWGGAWMGVTLGSMEKDTGLPMFPRPVKVEVNRDSMVSLVSGTYGAMP